MNLTAYKKTVEKRLNLMRILVACFLIIMAAVNIFVELPEDDPRNFITGMLIGMGCGGSIVALFIIMQQSKALKDENKLRQMYIEEHDERHRMILQKAGQPLVIYLSLVLVAAALIAGFFSITVTITLTAAAIFQLLASVILKFIYCKKM